MFEFACLYHNTCMYHIAVAVEQFIPKPWDSLMVCEVVYLS